MKEDIIKIQRLRVNAHVGVSQEERQQQQMLVLSLELTPHKGFTVLKDDVINTVDYVAVCELVKQVAGEKERKLIESLGEDVCGAVLAAFPLKAISLELEKRILWDTDWVGISMTRYSSSL